MQRLPSRRTTEGPTEGSSGLDVASAPRQARGEEASVTRRNASRPQPEILHCVATRHFKKGCNMTRIHLQCECRVLSVLVINNLQNAFPAKGQFLPRRITV